MNPTCRRYLVGLAAAGLLSLVLPFASRAGEDGVPPERPPRLHGFARLAPPEGSPSPEAGGAVHLRERGERQAIHVHVRGLVPGATYAVQVALGEQAETIGSITTHTGEPSPPRCFQAVLAPPQVEAPPEPPEEEDGAGDGGHWRPRPPLPPPPPRGLALFLLDREETTLHYHLGLRGLGDVEITAVLKIGEAALDLDVAARYGALEVTAEQVEALRAAGGSVEVRSGDAVVLAGAVETCLSEEARQHFAERRAGRGALRLDTARGDTMPLGVSSLAELAGATVSVLDGGENTVLAGTVGELMEIPPHHRRPPRDEPAGEPGDGNAEGGGGAVEEDPTFFALAEVHDARLRRGDADDSGTVDLTDAVLVLSYLFRGGPAPYCLDAADADDSGTVELTDPVLVLGALFRGGDLSEPFPARGSDLTPDGLFCREVWE